MDDAFLSYYNRELDYVRKLGAEFSDKHPKIAGCLRLDKETVEDPHVSRLIESFAFLTARVRQTIDDSFPELTEALIGILYPEFHAPYPSHTIAQLRVIKDNPFPQTIEQGRDLYVQGESNGDCIFKLCREVNVLPVSLEKIRVVNAPAKAPALPAGSIGRKAIKSVLSMNVVPFEGAKFHDFSQSGLNFYIDAQPQLAYKLLDYLLCGTLGVAIAKTPMDPNPTFLSKEQLVVSGLTGIDADYGAKFDGRTDAPYKKIIDFFAFPSRYMFFDILGLEEIWPKYESGFSLYFYFEETDPELIQGVDDSTFKLGCVPVVNLFEDRIDFIEAKSVTTEAKMQPSRSFTTHSDIYHISSVYAKSEMGETQELVPFYGAHKQSISGDSSVYWNFRRENSRFDSGRRSSGTDGYLSFVDLDFQIFNPESRWLVGADVICNNRDLPSKLPFGPELPIISFREGGAGLRAAFNSPPTPTISPKLESASRWQFIAHITLQSFSGPDGLNVLRDTLKLYDLIATRETTALIDGIISISTSMATTRIIRNGRASVCQGTAIELEFDELFYSGSSYILFGFILDEFFSQFCSINTFTQLSITIKQKTGRLIKCPPRIGTQALL